MSNVKVYRVVVPAGSSIGYGYARDEQGRDVTFAGDHRPMRELGEALRSGSIEVNLEDWQVLSVVEVKS